MRTWSRRRNFRAKGFFYFLLVCTTGAAMPKVQALCFAAKTSIGSFAEQQLDGHAVLRRYVAAHKRLSHVVL